MNEQSRKTSDPLTYRGQVKVSGFILLTLAAIFFLSGAFLLLLFALNGKIKFIPEVVTFLWLMSAFEYGLYHFSARPLILSKIFVWPDRIVIQMKTKEIVIPFTEILRLDYIHRKKTGEWFKIITKEKSKEKSYLVTASLHRCDFLIDSIYHARPELLAKNDYEQLRKRLIISDHALERFHELFRPPLRAWNLLQLFGIPALGSATLMAYESSEVVIHSKVFFFLEIYYHAFLIMAVLQILFLFLLEKPLQKELWSRLELDPGDRQRNFELERKHLSKLIPIYFATFSLSIISYGYSEYNLHSSIAVYESAKELGLKQGKEYTLNHKFNCIDCKYKIANGDLIEVNGFVVKVVALPGEKITLKSYDRSRRTIASSENVAVPKGKVAVFKSRHKTVVLIDETEIEGKVIK